MSRAALPSAVAVAAGAHHDVAHGAQSGHLADIITHLGEVDDAVKGQYDVGGQYDVVVCAGLALCHMGALYLALNPTGSGSYLPKDVPVRTASECLLSTALTGRGDAAMAKLDGYMKSLEDPRSAARLPIANVIGALACSVDEHGRGAHSSVLLGGWVRMVGGEYGSTV